MGISDRKRSIDVPVSINLDLNQEPKPNQFLIDNNLKGGDFVSRKKSGNVFAGSKLNVDGQGIFNVKNITPDLFKKFPKQTPVSGGNPPTPTPTMTQTPTPTLPPSFISTWQTDNEGVTNNNQIGIVLDSSGTFDFVIDWGDGNTDTITTWDQPELIHTYDEIGVYTITMTGVIDGFFVGNYYGLGGGDYGKILSVQQWGNVKLIDFGYQFYHCYNLDLSTVNDILDTSNLTDISYMFGECYGLTTINNIELWDVSNIINISTMFYECSLFDQPLNNWDVSNVTNMSAMFYECSLFDQPLNNWNVSSVTNMGFMFYACSSFNQPLNNWNVSSVTNMENMFVGTQFNQPLNNWNVSGVTIMSGMFGASPFNQNINDWDVSNVLNINLMFEDTPFNQPLSGWNVSNVTQMYRTFKNSQFNQPIGNWDVSKVTTMNSMFDISLFNQDIGNWNISGVTDFSFFMGGKTPLTLSTINLDAIYNGWSTKNPKPNKIIQFGSAKYSSASSAGKAILTGSTGSGGYGWAINDGGI